MGSRLRVVQGGAVVQQPLTGDPWEYQAECVEAFITSWRARGFSPVTIDNDTGLLERTLKALGRPAWEVTPDDIDKLVGDLAVAGADGRDPPGVCPGVQGFPPVSADPQGRRDRGRVRHPAGVPGR